jgi:hypothetical protein
VVCRVAVHLKTFEGSAVDEHVRSRAEALEVLSEVEDVFQAILLEMVDHSRQTDGDRLREL